MSAGQSLAVEGVGNNIIATRTIPADTPQGGARLPVVGVGVDIVDIQRFQMLYGRWKEAFLTRLFTEQEQAVCRKATGYRWYSLAGRFGAKESVKKILASCGEMARWIDIEVLNGQYGEPYINLYGEARAALERAGYASLVLSISHDAHVAIATVMAYS